MKTVVRLLEEMQVHLISARVSQKRLLKLREHLLAWGEEACALRERAMRDVLLHEYREVLEIYSLIPPEQWRQYESMEISDLREQLLLKRARSNLKVAFNQLVLKHVKANEGDAEETPDNPGRVGIHSE